MSQTPPEMPAGNTPGNTSHEQPLLQHRSERIATQPPEANIFDRINRARREHTPKQHRLNPRTRRLLSRTARAAATLLVIVAIACGVYAAYLRHALNASLPQVDGTLHVAGLSAPVTVTRDAHGVPSIQAANLDDALFAQGFVTAQDRLWQMDSLRRHAAGELAEILGSRLIPHDKTQRILQLRAAADRAVQQLPPDQLHQLEAYARGVNAFITAPSTHLPVEFVILRYTPKPWTPRDTLLVSLAMNQDLATGYPTKLARETLSAHLAPELVADLYPVGSFRDHPPGQTAPDLTVPKDEILQIPLDDSQSKLERPTATPQDLLAARAATLQQTCEGCRSGSNNWAVAGARSASGMPLVSNDMHLALGIPGIWYEAALHTGNPGDVGSLNVAGLTLPGTPFVIVGRNAHVAWGFTNLLADVQDVYIEHTRGSGDGAEFQRPDGSWSPVQHHTELIRVKGGLGVNLEVQTTTHLIGSVTVEAPIITPLYPSEHRTLSLLWNVYDPATLTEPFYAANTAADGPALVAALNSLGGPALSVIYADDGNHIGFHALGRIPIRGPAVQHPIAAPAEIPTSNGDSPADEDDNGGPAVAPANARHGMTGHPRLQLAGYDLPEHKRATSHLAGYTREPGTRPVASETWLSAAALRLRRRRPDRHAPSAAHHPRSKPQPAKSPSPEPADRPTHQPADPPLYTIGSPIPPTPIDATDPAGIWSGYIPFADLPAVTDPASGVLATANARVTPDGYPYAIALDWISPYRVERINKLLANRTGLTPADMLAVQMDVHSEFDLALAHRIAYALDQSARQDGSRQSKRLRQAADILRNWDGQVAVDAAAPAIVTATRATLLPMLLTAKIEEHDKAFHTASAAKPDALAALYTWGESAFVLERLLLLSPARWLPSGVADWNALLTTAVTRALDMQHAPADLATWSYSRQHPVELDHPLFSQIPLLPWLLGIQATTGPHAVAGDTSTVKATARSYGPSERFTADLSNPDAATLNLPTGQSDNPRSPWFLDQFPLWLSGQTLRLATQAPSPRAGSCTSPSAPCPTSGTPASASHVLTLQP